MLNLTYVPECLILLGRTEQWNCRVIGASPVAFENVCPKLLIPSSVWLTIVNQPGWRKKRGLKNIFAIVQSSPKYLIWENDHKRDHTKWQRGHNSDSASTSLAPLVRAGGSCGLEWTEAPVSSRQREESEVPECKKISSLCQTVGSAGQFSLCLKIYENNENENNLAHIC